MRGVALALALIATPARAHHDAAVGRVGGSVGGGTALGSLEDRAPRVDLGLGWQGQAFRRTLRGWERFADGDLGAVEVHRLVPAARLVLGRGTSVAVEAPVGLVRQSTPGTAPKTTAGPGDVQVVLAQQVLDVEGPGRLWVRGGLVLPTGRYSTETALSLVDVRPGEDGALQVAPYDVRASLGGGALVATAGMDGQWRQERWVVHGGLDLALPLTDTPDAIRWGWDAQVQAGARVVLGEERWVVGASLDGRRHARDRLEQRIASTGVIERVAVGGRAALGGRVEAALRVTEATSCGASVRVPVVQHVQGVQLVETSAATLRCQVALSRTPR